MKLYFHYASDNFSNCYLVGNELTGQAVLIDPSVIDDKLLEHIEKNKFSLEAVLITHGHKSHSQALPTILKIYNPRIYAAETEIKGAKTKSLIGDGCFQEAGFNISYMSVPGHSPDSVLYKIEQVVFTGDSIFAGRLGSTGNSYGMKNLIMNINNKLLNQNEDLIIMPGHGPPSTVGAELRYNTDILLQ